MLAIFKQFSMTHLLLLSGAVPAHGAVHAGDAAGNGAPPTPSPRGHGLRNPICRRDAVFSPGVSRSHICWIDILFWTAAAQKVAVHC